MFGGLKSPAGPIRDRRGFAFRQKKEDGPSLKIKSNAAAKRCYGLEFEKNLKAAEVPGDNIYRMGLNLYREVCQWNSGGV
jgi:hypothetical protein